MLGITINLMIGLPLVVGWPISLFKDDYHGYGFYACPVVTTCVEWSIMAYMAYQFKFLKTEQNCWPKTGWSLKNIEKDHLKAYMIQYIPTALSISSDYWRAAAIGGICTTIGTMELGVFNMSYRVLQITLTFIASVGMASGIKIASALGSGNGFLAKRHLITGLMAIGVLLIILASSILIY